MYTMYYVSCTVYYVQCIVYTMYYVNYMYKMCLVCVQYVQSMYIKLVGKILKSLNKNYWGKFKES